MAAARDLLRRAEPNGRGLARRRRAAHLRALKARRRAALQRARRRAPRSSSSRTAPQTAIGHELGHGPIAPGEPIVLDLFPRDRETGCFADMTRTFVVGEPAEELARYQRLCREALDRARRRRSAPGRNGRDVCTSRLRLLRGARLPDAALEGAGRGARGRLLPRARPRRRARGARAAVARARAPRTSSWPATSSPSSPASTGRASAAAGSRTSCSSPRRRREADRLPVRPDAVEHRKRATETAGDRDDVPRGAALPAAAGVRRAGQRAAGRSTSATSTSSGRPRAASGSPGSSRSRSSTSGSRRTRSGTSAAS